MQMLSPVDALPASSLPPLIKFLDLDKSVMVFCFFPTAESPMILFLCFHPVLLLTLQAHLCGPSLFLPSCLSKSLTSILKWEWQQYLISVKNEPWVSSSGTVCFHVNKHTRVHICSEASPHGLHPMWTYLLMKSIFSPFLCMRAASTSKET